MLQPLSVRIQGIQDDVLTVQTPDGQIWNIPAQAVHGTAKIGQELRLIAVAPLAEDAGKQAFAHALLNELLGNTLP